MMPRLAGLVVAAIAFLMCAEFTAAAETIDTVKAVERLFREPVAADWFASGTRCSASPSAAAP